MPLSEQKLGISPRFEYSGFMGKFRKVTSADTRITLLEFIESLVAELGKEADYEKYRNISQTCREPYWIEGRESPCHRSVPDPLWPSKVELIDEIRALFLDSVTQQGWEVRSQPNDRLLLGRELEEAKLDIYSAVLNRRNTLFSNIQLSRKIQDFEAALIQQFEYEAAQTPPGEYTLDEMFTRMLRRCNFANAIRDETKKRIIAAAEIDQLHRKTGPKPKKR